MKRWQICGLGLVLLAVAWGGSSGDSLTAAQAQASIPLRTAHTVVRLGDENALIAAALGGRGIGADENGTIVRQCSPEDAATGTIAGAARGLREAVWNNRAVEGGVPWVRINGEDVGNPISRVYPPDDPSRWPRWLPGRLRDHLVGEYGVLMRYARELAFLVASEQTSQTVPHFERASEEPVLGPGEARWESVDVLSAEVLYDPVEGLFKMWYTGFDGERYAIGYATSRDGLRWERYPDNPVLASTGGEWDREGVGFPAVVHVNGKYYMYFTRLKRARAHRDAALGLAISDDGVRWERLEDPILLPGAAGVYDARALVGPEVFLDDGGTWHLLYAGGRDFPGDDDGRWVILHATSSNGISWRVDPEPVLTGEVVGMEDALNPEVLQLSDGSYWLTFSARVEHSHFHLFLARSDDGVTWQLVSREELLKPGEPGRFDEKALNHPALVLHEGKLHLFYTGYDRRNRRAIGLAIGAFAH